MIFKSLINHVISQIILFCVVVVAYAIVYIAKREEEQYYKLRETRL